jgi:hypothetical protein
MVNELSLFLSLFLSLSLSLSFLVELQMSPGPNLLLDYIMPVEIDLQIVIAWARLQIALHIFTKLTFVVTLRGKHDFHSHSTEDTGEKHSLGSHSY